MVSGPMIVHAYFVLQSLKPVKCFCKKNNMPQRSSSGSPKTARVIPDQTHRDPPIVAIRNRVVDLAESSPGALKVLRSGSASLRFRNFGAHR
jgi:hypothetical protein